MSRDGVFGRAGHGTTAWRRGVVGAVLVLLVLAVVAVFAGGWLFAWPLVRPLDPLYDEMIKGRYGDIANAVWQLGEALQPQPHWDFDFFHRAREALATNIAERLELWWKNHAELAEAVA